MNYTSTRDNSVKVSSAQAIAAGISPDGGLYVPETIPSFSHEELLAIAGTDYRERAVKVLGKYLTDFTAEELRECVDGAYTDTFGGTDVAPVVDIADNRFVLELWHGPTCAFKDMALQLLPHLLTRSVKKTCDGKEIVILVATSGDTGKAALEGFRDVPGTRIMVFYPVEGVSAIQKKQMVTQEGGNVGVCAIKGNFDDAQTGVKRIFTSPDIAAELAAHNMAFSSANSINWGRLAPQIVYYISAYADLMNKGVIKQKGDPINVVVPTGNFGNILAAYYARKMGLPIHRLICASNANNVLTDFIRSGVYDRNRPFHTTISPSMDILISSNLERLIYDLSGCDSVRVKGWMERLAAEGRYEVDDDVKDAVKSLFWAGCCDDNATQNTIREVFTERHYLADTHTAVALNVYDQYVRETGDTLPTVIASTASPYKFAPAVLGAIAPDKTGEDEFAMLEALREISGAAIPAPLAGLKGKAVRFDRVCEGAAMREAVLDMLSV
ncbi:MAG: threonine synthase [Clostridia bacterium]|nr:threonine synthase [Clostridia bacterium]